MDASDSDFDDLIGFLAPETRLDIRRTALQYVLEASSKMIDNASTKFYLRDDAALGNKLPLALQYYEGSRESVPEIRQKLVEALYQLCSTKHGRCSLRKKGAYALLRELDKATSEKRPDPNAPPPKMKPPTLLAQEEHTLHALIGILIRYEEDLGIDTEAVHSLKQLE
ncbi:unnamed protein product, partial [Mesorhabditis spiculigera]